MEKTEKRLALDFLNLTSSGKANEAFARYIHTDFKHHNAFYKGDAKSLMTAMDKQANQNPEQVIEVKHVLPCGNLVVVHSFVQQNQEDPGAAVVHIFRFDGNKIVELWDMGQPIPKKVVNENGVF